MSKTYRFAFRCDNCRHKWQVDVPVGKAVERHFGYYHWELGEKLPCPRCGTTDEVIPDSEANDKLANTPAKGVGR